MKGSKIDLRKEEFERMFNEGFSDYKIADALGINHCTVFQYRKKHNYIRNSLKENPYVRIEKEELNIILGTVVGDATLRKEYKNTKYVTSHSIAQKQYCEYIVEKLHSLGAKIYYSKRNIPDKRTGKLYESYICTLPSNPALNDLYTLFYPNGKKVIPNNQFFKEHFNEISLAYLYMDDGNKMQNGYSIATMCFSIEEILEFRKLLFDKFNLETSMFSDKRIYIKAKSKEHFKELILPYIHETMMYKL
ncbi:MAG: hypothetical protein IJU02_07395 [Lachnospiraceae bacterium]|nr:hypothetical protein [Lachnospiraceae bacterium]